MPDPETKTGIDSAQGIHERRLDGRLIGEFLLNALGTPIENFVCTEFIAARGTWIRYLEEINEEIGSLS